MTVKTIKMSVHWEGMSAYYRSMIIGAMRLEGLLAKGADYNAFFDAALEVMFYANQIKAGLIKCDCGCEDR